MILTLSAAAARLSLSVTTVRRLLASGVLPYVRLSPRRIGIPEAALCQYAETGWRSDKPTGDGLLSFSKAESAYFAACTRAQRAAKPRRSKRSSAAIFSLPSASGTKPSQA
jgi:excisionase family DNA binding protein